MSRSPPSRSWLVLVVATMGCGSSFDCGEACQRAVPICEDRGDLDCEENCGGYLSTDDCVDEGERALRCFDRHPGSCTNGCDPGEIVEGCVPGCEEAFGGYFECLGV